MTKKPWATSDEELGYFSEGNPTDAQLRLQDELDSITQDYLQELNNVHAMVKGLPAEEVEHDIYKLSYIREMAEQLLELEDIY